jgi:hypothetical protein
MLYASFEIFTAMIMKYAIFWYVMLVAHVRTDVSEECFPSIIWVKRISGLGKTLAVTCD